LIRATLRVDLPFSVSGRWIFNTSVTVIFILSFLFFAARCLKDLPSFGYPIMKVASTYLKEGFLKAGETNIVSSIGLDYRVLDTLGEATVLFTSVIGVMAIVRRIGRKKGDQVVKEEDE